jgi:hypothetical protein
LTEVNFRVNSDAPFRHSPSPRISENRVVWHFAAPL